MGIVDVENLHCALKRKGHTFQFPFPLSVGYSEIIMLSHLGQLKMLKKIVGMVEPQERKNLNQRCYGATIPDPEYLSLGFLSHGREIIIFLFKPLIL